MGVEFLCKGGGISSSLPDVRFSNRPLGSSAFRPSTTAVFDVARGLVLLFGIGTKALPSGDSKTRWNNLTGGLAVRLMVGPSGHAISPHPSSREGIIPPLGGSSFLLLHLILHGFHAAAVACSGVHRNSVPSTHMRCMITAKRRASATIAFSCRGAPHDLVGDIADDDLGKSCQYALV